MDVDPYAYIKSEMKDDRDQPLIGEMLLRVCRVWDAYSDALGLSGQVPAAEMINFDLAFFAVVADQRALEIEWLLQGCQLQYELDDGPTLEEGLNTLLTPDGVAAFWRDMTPGLTPAHLRDDNISDSR
jgi:hypothetical protein